MPTITMTLSKEEMDQLISGALVECMVLPSMKPGSKFYLQVESKYEMPPKTPQDSIKESLSIDIPFSRMTFADLACEPRLKDRPWEVQGMHYVYAVAEFSQFERLKQILNSVSDKLKVNLIQKYDYTYVIRNVEVQFCSDWYIRDFKLEKAYSDAFYYSAKNCTWMHDGVTLEKHIMDILKGEEK